MSEQITIAGEVFHAPVRYEEGHELTAGEAAALNQTYHENLRNNFAKKVKDAKDGGSFDLAALQEEFSQYAEDYQFGVRTGGGGGATRDPVQVEAQAIARGQIRAMIKKKGKKNVSPKAITAAVKQLLEKNPHIYELAKERVAQAQAAAHESLAELVDDLPTKAEAA